MTKQIDEIDDKGWRSHMSIGPVMSTTGAKKNFAPVGKTIPTQTHIAKSHELKQNNKTAPSAETNGVKAHDFEPKKNNKPYDTRSEPSKKYKQNEEFEVNENLENILVHAWNKDAVNLRSALDAEMQSRISDHVDTMVADVSARLFNPSNEEHEG